MLYIKKGNMFEEKVDAIVNTINCLGVMGGGIALIFKQKYPEMFSEYKNLCYDEKINIGRCHIYECAEQLPRFIINFPTKYDFKKPSQYSYIEKGLDDLLRVIKEKNIKSIVIPALGCRLGGLDWVIVKDMIIHKLAPIIDDDNISVILYEPL